MVCRGWRRFALVFALGSTLAFAAACGTTVAGSGSGAAPVGAPDPRSATYTIENDTVTLVNGRAERETTPRSSAKRLTTLSDIGATGDIDGDGRPDAVVILVDRPGGSGTFYYVAALLNAPSGVVVTPAVLLGDRITVRGLAIDSTSVVVDVLDRAAGQPMTSSPSVSVTKRFTVEGGTLKAR